MKAAKDYLKFHDSPSWKSYCGEIGIPYSTFANYVRLYGIYGPDGLGIGQDRFTRIGPRKLLDMITVIQRDKSNEVWADGSVGWNFGTQEWLAKAETLSESDLRMEINESLGRENKKHGGTVEGEKEAAGDMGDTPPTPMTPTRYKKLVKAAPCCVCQKEGETTYAHWPRTKNRGEFGIPLCGRCHRIQEDTAKSDWFRDNFVNISQWLDGLIKE
jgi:hypothetical protein